MTEWNSNLDEVSKKLKSIVPSEIAFGDLFNPEFMGRHTKSDDIDAFFAAGGFDINSQAELEAIAEEDLDAHVRSQTTFSSWGELKVRAYEEWATKKME